jgi:hypothetical protein
LYCCYRRVRHDRHQPPPPAAASTDASFLWVAQIATPRAGVLLVRQVLRAPPPRCRGCGVGGGAHQPMHALLHHVRRRQHRRDNRRLTHPYPPSYPCRTVVNAAIAAAAANRRFPPPPHPKLASCGRCKSQRHARRLHVLAKYLAYPIRDAAGRASGGGGSYGDGGGDCGGGCECSCMCECGGVRGGG